MACDKSCHLVCMSVSSQSSLLLYDAQATTPTSALSPTNTQATARIFKAKKPKGGQAVVAATAPDHMSEQALMDSISSNLSLLSSEQDEDDRGMLRTCEDACMCVQVK